MKLLELPHEKAAYRCPVNGLGDIYQWKTGNRIPEHFLFDSRLGCKVISYPGTKPRSMVFFSEGGIGRSEYLFWSNKIGYRIIAGEGMSFSETLPKLYELIDGGIPVILFGLDMFYLPYHKNFYHKIHVPGHVNLMVGYDDETIYLHDNDRDGVQTISHSDLQRAWADGYMGFSKKNAYFGIDMSTPNRNIGEILHLGFSETANAFLHPATSFLGEQGYQTLMCNLEDWSNETATDELKEICMHLVTFTASTIPEPPKKLLPYDSGVYNPHQGCRDTFASALKKYRQDYDNEHWNIAADLFEQSGFLFEQLTDHIADIIISDNYAHLKECIPTVKTILGIETEAFQNLAVNK